MRRFWLSLLLVVIAGVFYFWLQSPQWLEEWNNEHQQMIAMERQAGRQFGQSSDQQGCFDQAIQKTESCKETEYRCTVGGGTYLKACWESSQPSAGFCADVPPYKAEPGEDDKAWVKDRCTALGALSKACRLLVRQQQQLCSESPSGSL